MRRLVAFFYNIGTLSMIMVSEYFHRDMRHGVNTMRRDLIQPAALDV